MTHRNDIPALSADLSEFADEHEGRLAAALARVAEETREEAIADQIAAHAESLTEQERERVRYRKARYLEARPGEYADSSLGRLLPQQDVQGKGVGWLDSGAKNGMFVGPSGHGKTDLAYAIGNAAVERGLWVEAWSVPELVQALAPLPKHARNDATRTARQEHILDSVKECQLLILDELGGEEATGFVAERWRAQLLEILSARDGEAWRRTIVTLNGGTTADKETNEEKTAVKAAAFNRLAAHYDARVATRLRKDMVGIWVEGECLRQVSTWHPF